MMVELIFFGDFMFSLLCTLSAFSMPSSDFTVLQDQVQDASFSSEKFSVIQLATRTSTFTAAQIKELISEISFASDQIEALEMLAPRLEDPSRSFMILEAFSFQSSKTEAQEILTRLAPKKSLKERQQDEINKTAKEKQQKEQAEKERIEREEKEEQARVKKKAQQKKERKLDREEGPIFQWAGRCPKRDADCIRFNSRLFSPLVSHQRNKLPDHALIFEVTGPGVLEISAEMGKRYNCKRQRVNRKTKQQRFDKSISLSPGRNRINITELIPDWKREYAEIHVRKGLYTSTIHLEEWKRCRE